MVAAASGVLAAGLLGTAALMPSPWAIASLAVAMVGFFGLMPAFWALPSTFLTGASAAAGIAFISVTGNIGNFSGPYLFGWLSDRTGSYRMGLLCMTVCAIAAAIIMAARASRPRSSFQQEAAVAETAGQR
jgi:ACS family tartrate transporter-like MFS transporter